MFCGFFISGPVLCTVNVTVCTGTLCANTLPRAGARADEGGAAGHGDGRLRLGGGLYKLKSVYPKLGKRLVTPTLEPMK